MTNNYQLIGLFAAVLAGEIGHLDYSQCSNFVESACARCLDLQSPIEDLDSEILQFNLVRYSKLQFEDRQNLILKSLRMAKKWLAKGVRVHLCIDEPKLRSCIHLFKVIFSFGALNILDNPTVMIMNSRPGRKVRSDSPWLVKTASLARYSMERNWTLVSSYGSIPYFVVSWLAKGHDLIVVCDGALPFMDTQEAEAKFYNEFSDFFDMGRTLFLSGFTRGVLPKLKDRWIIRDEMVAAISKIMAPSEIRPDGIMSRLLQSAHSTDKVVITDFLKKTGKVVSRNRLGSKTSANLPQFFVQRLRDDADGDLLFHYTRACFGPWPGQSWSNYLSDLMSHTAGSAHDALDTLIRILTERKIRANGTWTRGSTPVVSFTENGPTQLGAIRKWRRGLIRYTFEPYSIGFSRKVLLEKGIRKVVYGTEQDFTTLRQDSKPFFQLASSSCSDWTPEKEWRLLGDLDFHGMETSDWFVIVPDHESACKILRSVIIINLRIYVASFETANLV